MKATRKIKFSLGIKIASILSCLAIVSVGFASWWIINYPEAVEYSEGSFEVYAINRKEIKFDGLGVADDSNPQIVFGHPGSGTTSWLGYSTSVLQENLSTILKFNITLTTNESDKLSDYLSSVDVTLNTGAYGDIDAKYVAPAKVSYRVGTEGEFAEITPDDNGVYKITGLDYQTADIYLKLDFGWGSQTEGQNPYTYYNNETYTDDLATKATDMLTAINGLAGNTYTVTIDTTAKSGSGN